MTHSTHYLRATLDSNYDVILIGSGIGNLTAASLLSQIGKKVLVLEQHYVLGGYTQTFSRKGKYKWDVGVHYVPDVVQKNAMSRIGFDLISQKRLRWNETSSVYDRVIIGTRQIDYIKGLRRHIQALKKEFPTEALGIDRYYREVRLAVASMAGFFGSKAFSKKNPLQFLFAKNKKIFNRYAHRTLKEVLDSLFEDQTLKAFLGAQWGDYGLPPAQSSFVMHALTTLSLHSGVSYPIGGADQIAETIASVIVEHGGTLLTQANVAGILVQENKAYGVRMADGKKILAQKIISGAGIFNTIESLLPKETVEQHGLEQKLAQFNRSCSHAALHIGFDKSTHELHLPDRNYWIYQTGTIDEGLEAYRKDRESQIPFIFVNFPSAKDPEWNASYPNSSTAVALVFEDFINYEPWNGTEWKKRGPEYEAFKKKLETRILNDFKKFFPHLSDHIAYVELSTPLSTQTFMNCKRGEIYGVSADASRLTADWIHPTTPVQNLYLAGVDTLVDSVVGGLGSGFIAALQMENTQILALIARFVGKSQWNQIYTSFVKGAPQVVHTESKA